MEELVNTEVSGFCSFDSVISITDQRGRPFYYFRNPNRNRVTFNLPAGIYYTDNRVKRLNKALRYELPELPKPNRWMKRPEDFELKVEDNPNKCSVYLEKGIIIIDPALIELPQPMLTHVLQHELGHYQYGAKGQASRKDKMFYEVCCDKFAAKQMCEHLGYNPSQSFYSTNICLSEGQAERKQELYNYLKQAKAYER